MNEGKYWCKKGEEIMKHLKKILVCIFAVCLLIGCKANINEGLELLEAEKYKEAIACFEKDIAEERNLDEAYRGIGIAKYELGEYTASLEAFENALKNEASENATMCALMGASHLQLGELEAALENYANALKQEDLSAELKQEILFNEIAIYQELGDWDIVKEKVESYVKSYPDDERLDKTVEFLESR